MLPRQDLSFPFLWILFMLAMAVAAGKIPCADVGSERRGAMEYIEQFFESHVNGFDGHDDAASPLVERRLPFGFGRFGFSDETGISDADLGHHAGYFSIKGTHSSRMFYVFFESRGKNSEDPVVLWMSGGPGCSSELALFYENGPYKLVDGLNLTWNDYGWDKVSNIIYVDQPIGTGFSYSSDDRDIPHDEEGVSEDMYQFLQAFFQVHPEFAKNDFFVTGESYAGHYIPALASRIHMGNKNREGLPINLKGFAIGNGLTNPEIQYKAYADYALEMGLIEEDDLPHITSLYPDCEQAIRQCGKFGYLACVVAYRSCNNIFSAIMLHTNGTNYYDIRKKCIGSMCYDFSNMETYLNLETVKQTLGVGDIRFVACSSYVYQKMIQDWMRNLEVGIPALLNDGIRLLVYAGEYDLICNWLGNSRWVSAIEWSGKNGYNAASPELFMAEGEEAGVVTTYGALSFLKVYDAGHMVPMDQPKASLEMIRRFTRGIPLNGQSFLSDAAATNSEEPVQELQTNIFSQ